jgi:hypothetical protein
MSDDALRIESQIDLSLNEDIAIQHDEGVMTLIARHGRNGSTPIPDSPIFAIDVSRTGLCLFIRNELGSINKWLPKWELIGRLSGGIEWTIGNVLCNALSDGIVEAEKFDAYYGPVWHRLGLQAFGIMADEVEHNPELDLDGVLGSMKSALARREYLVKIGLRIPRRKT